MEEIDANPELLELMALAAYEDAYSAYQQWENLPPKQRKDVPAPTGTMANLVQQHRIELVKLTKR